MPELETVDLIPDDLSAYDKYYLALAYLSFNDIGSYEEYAQSSR